MYVRDMLDSGGGSKEGGVTGWLVYGDEDRCVVVVVLVRGV